MPFILRLTVRTILVLLSLALALCALVLTDLVYAALARAKPRAAVPSGRLSTKKRREASIIVLNWNGRELLTECLSSVIEAIKTDGGNHELIVVDNGSTDGSVELVREKFPEARLVALPQNVYFSAGNNAGARAATCDTLVFLNNDMKVDRHFLRPLLDGFLDETVFAVSSQIFLEGGTGKREETGRTRGVWSKGLFHFSHEPMDNDSTLSPVFWFGGGSAAVDRAKFLALGGFDTLYHPMYVEDTDLSYRAWKRGWRVLFAPESIVYHKHRASSRRRFGEEGVNRMVLRNQLLFTWRNITSPRLFASHLFYSPRTALWLAVTPGGVRAAWTALLRLPRIIPRRLRERREASISDETVLATLGDPLVYRRRFPSFAMRSRHSQRSLNILMVTPYLPMPGFHAGGGRMWTLVKGLSERHRVSVVSFWDRPEEEAFIPTLRAICESVVPIRRVPSRDYPRSVRLDPFAKEFGDPRMREAIRAARLRSDFDIVQFEYLQMAPLFEPGPEVAVLTHHEVQHAVLRRECARLRFPANIPTLLKWMGMVVLETELCQRFDRVITMTESDARELSRFAGALSLEVIRTPVDLEYFRPLSEADTGSAIVYVGYYGHRPNVDAVLYFATEIMPLIEDKDLQFYVIGSFPPPELLALQERDPRVIVTGYLDDYRPYLAKSAMMVVPVRLGSGIRGKILEAWGMEKAVVSTSLGAAGLPARHGENILIADNPRDFAAAVTQLLADPGLRAKLGKAGRQEAERSFGVHRFVEQHEEMYRALAKERRLHVNVLQ